MTERKITVCNHCLTVSCWNAELVCEEFWDADIFTGTAYEIDKERMERSRLRHLNERDNHV